MSNWVRPVMLPAPGERMQRYVGDRVRFSIGNGGGGALPRGWRARLRTNLGRATVLRREVLESHAQGLPLAGSSWRDLPMEPEGEGWHLELPLAENGYFSAKAYLLDPSGWQHWPEGPDAGIAVHPDFCRTGNTLYCVFPRLLGKQRSARRLAEDGNMKLVRSLDEQGYTVIPESGKLRDVIGILPHVVDRLGCRFLHLLPVTPTPTTYARFGRFGSPYAAQDLTAIDPALVVFDKRTTGIDQFRELTLATHQRGARVILDIAINHTGWGSTFQERHPEWFVRNAAGEFASPGAWGVTWEDLVELRHENVELWDELAEVFLTWCRRGVDGFRCDAGYMVPVGAWQYIIGRVTLEYPNALFLLEGLGGAWEATSRLLGEGGMQWAYSELFQNYEPRQIAGYLDHHFRQAERTGLLVHYSETHDNERLAKRGRNWALLRNRLCALASTSGGFGFTSGVEWLATEKINVHQATGLAWDSGENIIPELANLNRLLQEHPAFFDGAEVRRLSADDSPVLVLHRVSAEGRDEALVLVNNDLNQAQTVELWREENGFSTEPGGKLRAAAGRSAAVSGLESWVDLLRQPVSVGKGKRGGYELTLAGGGAFCLAPSPRPAGLHGEDYRQRRAAAAWGLQAFQALGLAESGAPADWRALAEMVSACPFAFLSGIGEMARGEKALEKAVARSEKREAFPQVVVWSLVDGRRVMPVPPGHWLLLEDAVPFRATLNVPEGGAVRNVESIPVRRGHAAAFAPQAAGEALLHLERYGGEPVQVDARVCYLEASPDEALVRETQERGGSLPSRDDFVLLTNGRGGMSRLCVDLGGVRSKYDCVLGANLHPDLPVDRHILVKRVRVWVSADGFISPLDFLNLVAFQAGPPAVWDFVANAGDGRTVQIRLEADMVDDRNEVSFVVSRPTAESALGKQLPADADVRLTVRVDIEDRGYHGETKRNPGADHHFSSHVRELTGAPGAAGTPAGLTGFAFTPATDRQLFVCADAGAYHAAPEWSHNIPHPVEQARGQVGEGDAYSPGWFEIPLPKGGTARLLVSAEKRPSFWQGPFSRERVCAPAAGMTADDVFGNELVRATRAFVVKRGSGKTVIAGYPWFLDWGRDTFIAARGLLAAGMADEVGQMLRTFARFGDRGTLPNTIFGEDASNRDTSDAPLWFAVVCEELARMRGAETYALEGAPGRTLESAARNIARYYCSGTATGIRMDAESGLVWSPSHFTWMDTNHPAATPREGYPVEIQALWWRLLRQMARLGQRPDEPDWEQLAERARVSIEERFWSEELGYYADVLAAGPGQAARGAVADFAVRSNALFLVSLGVVSGVRAKRCVEAARRHLVVPGGLRSLAPLPVTVPLPVQHCGRLLNNPGEPYWGRYEGDEDTRRKPAYHNGTAWTWTLPVFCEALARAWDFSEVAVAAARAYLGGLAGLLRHGVLGQLPEILDGDAPHQARGCDAQAWSATEALRVWMALRPGAEKRPGD